MRCVGLVVVLLPSVALAQNAPAESTPKKADKPKGHLVDPWARMPRPRDGMKLPDPRKAAEKATDAGVVAPTTPERTEPTPEPTPEEPPQITTAPAIAPPFVPAAATLPELPPPSTPFGVTKLTYKEPPPVSPHAGLTLEVAAGFGMIYAADRNRVVSSPGGVGGIDLGIGGWLSEDVALTARVAGAATTTTQGTVAATYLGPSLQIWPTNKTWLGFGIGLAGLSIDATRDQDDYALSGVGFDLRIGHTIYETGKHSFNGSLEITPSTVKQESPYGGHVSVSMASVALLIGWQYL